MSVLDTIREWLFPTVAAPTFGDEVRRRIAAEAKLKADLEWQILSPFFDDVASNARVALQTQNEYKVSIPEDIPKVIGWTRVFDIVGSLGRQHSTIFCDAYTATLIKASALHCFLTKNRFSVALLNDTPDPSVYVLYIRP